MPAHEFAGKVAVITGAANGIGKATLEHFLENGARVVAVDQQEDALAKFAGHDGILAVATDVTSAEDWQRVILQTEASFGRIDFLANCAGIAGPLGRFADIQLADFERVMAVNVTGTFLGMQAVTPLMKAVGKGAIVNISSIAGARGNPRLLPYTTSKHAVNGLSKCAALDLVEFGIRVNVVAPAPIDTAMMRYAEETAAERLNIDVERAHELLSANLPMKRYGQPEEIADIIGFLCSDRASFMNGAIVAADGGVLAR